MSCHDKVRARTCVLGLCSCPGISLSLHLKKIPPFAGADAEEDPLWVVWRMVGWGKGVWEGDDRRPWVLPFKPQFGGVEE